MLNSNWVHPQPRDEVLNRVGEDPSAIERGLTVLEMDLPLLEGVTLDLLAVDAEGCPVGILAGEMDEDALLIRGLDVQRAWRVVGHLMRRIYHGEGFRFEEPLRLVLLAQRISQRLREVVGLLRGLPLDLREYRVVVAEGRRLPVVADAPVPERSPSRVARRPERAGLDPGGPEGGGIGHHLDLRTPRATGPRAGHSVEPLGQTGEAVTTEAGPRPEQSVPVAPPADVSPDPPLHRLFQEARGKIRRVGEEIEEDARDNSVLFLVAGSVLAELSLGPDGLVGSLGDADGVGQRAAMNDRRAMDEFLNRVFRFYFDLTSAPVRGPEALSASPSTRGGARPAGTAGHSAQGPVE